MKMTSGRRKHERQSRALDRLLVAVFKASEKWETRRQAEIATLRQRTGRIHEQ